ncbi:MAG: hypothetical protein U0O21_03855 [Lachnospiraceae bacterium]
MRKTRVFAAVTTAAVAASVCAFASEQENKKAEDAYLILDLEKAGIEEFQKVDNGEAYGTYLDLAASDHDGYTVNGIYSDEPVIAQFLALNESLADYEAAGIYEIIYDVPANADETDTADSPDVNEYHLELAMKENSTVFHYGIVEGELVKTPLQASFGEYAQPTCGLYSDTNHWLVIHLKASETADTENESGEEKPADEAVQTTSAASESTPETTGVPTTKAPETKPAPTTTPTKAPETTAPTTTAHTHTWVPVTNTVHHDATYKEVWVQDSAAWDETVVTKDAWDENVLVQDAYDEPVYEWVGVCNSCGHRFQPGEDVNEHMAAGCWSSWHDEWTQTGSVHHDAVYNTVHHEAETTVVHHEATGHNEQVVDQEAWDETVTTGYKCSGCGATK